MKVLITGATGFIGAGLCRRLVERGDDVHAVAREGSDNWRISDLLPHLHLHAADLRDAGRVSQVVLAARPETIVHCATYGGFASQTDTAAILDTNIAGVANLLRAAERSGYGCFINTGSSSEYGHSEQPMRERDRLQPVGDYGVAKAAATLYCQSEAMQKRLPITTLRLFSPYGPWDDPTRLIPYVIASLLRGESPRLSTPGSVRDYVYSSDILDLYQQVIDKPQCGQVYNAGSGRQHAIGDVVKTIATVVGSDVEIQWNSVPQQRPEPRRWEADITAARSVFGWEPSTSLEMGVERTVAWAREHQDRTARDNAARDRRRGMA